MASWYWRAGRVLITIPTIDTDTKAVETTEMIWKLTVIVLVIMLLDCVTVVNIIIFTRLSQSLLLVVLLSDAQILSL